MSKKQAQEQYDKMMTEAEKLLEIINAPESVVWKPEEGEECYGINKSGGVNQIYYNTHFHSQAHLRGRIKKTREEAQRFADSELIMAELQRKADEANGGRPSHKDWQDRTRYIIFYSCSADTVKVTQSERISDVGYLPCFYTAKSALQALDELVEKYGEDKVKTAISGSWK